MSSFGEQLRRVRWSLHRTKWGRLSQSEFAARFGLTFGAVKDAEQDRGEPSRAMRVLVAAVDLDAAFVDRAVVLAAERERVEREARN